MHYLGKGSLLEVLFFTCGGCTISQAHKQFRSKGEGQLNRFSLLITSLGLDCLV